MVIEFDLIMELPLSFFLLELYVKLGLFGIFPCKATFLSIRASDNNLILSFLKNKAIGPPN